MIKNLLWKQAMEAAKKKFGNLNTNEAVKFLNEQYKILVDKIDTYNKANKKAVEEFKGFKPEVVPKYDPFKNLRGDESFDELLELGGKKIKKFDPFKKEGKKIDFGKYHDKRKRGEFDEGGIILPQPKPYNFKEKLDFLREIKGGVGPKFYLQMMSDTLNEGVEKKAITKEERDNFLKRFTGTISEGWTSAIDDENLYLNEGEYERYPPKFNEGGFTGSNLYFQDKFDEFDWATRYNNMSPKEGLDQVIQDYKNAMKMEEGELGKLPPIPLSALRAGLGYLLKQLAGGKFNQERRDVLEFFTKPGKPTELTNKILYKKVKKKSDDLSKKIAEEISKYSTKHAEGGLAGMLGETQPQQVGLAQDREALVRKLYDAAGGFEGTNKTFLEFMADVMYEGDYIYAKGGRVGYEGGGYVPLPLGRWNDISDAFEKYQEDNKNTIGPLMGFKEFFNNYIDNLASGGRVGLKDGGMTPSEKWMRNYYYDGKGGYDTWMSFQEFMTGPGIDLWYKHIGKAEGGIIGLKNGGLLEKYKEYAPKGPWTKGLTDTEITYELYRLLEPYMSLFMKEGGRVSFSEGKGLKSPGRRKFMKIAAAIAAMIPGVKWGAKVIKPAAKVMDDIKISLRGDGDWERDIDGYWSGGNWVNYSFEALTDKGKQILAKLSKGKNASLVDQGDGVYFPGKTVSSKAGNYLKDEAEHAVDAVDSIKKSKGSISLNTQVGKNVRGGKEGYKTYSSKDINKKTILDEADDLWVGDYGGYRNKGFYDENVEMILDIINPTKKAEGGRIGYADGGDGGSFDSNKYYEDEYNKYIKDIELGLNEFADTPMSFSSFVKMLREDRAQGGRIGLDAGGPPIMPVQLGPLQLQPRASGSFTKGQPYGPNFKEKTWTDNIGISGMLDLPGGFSLTGDYDKFRTKDRLYTADDEYVDERVRGDHDAWNVGINWKKEFADGGSVLQRPMFYQGGLTKTVPPKKGPMPQGLQSDVYDGIMRPGVINGRN